MSYTSSSRSSGLLATLLALLCKYLSPCHTQLSGCFSSVQPFHQLLIRLMFSSSGALSSSMLSITSPSKILYVALLFSSARVQTWGWIKSLPHAFNSLKFSSSCQARQSNEICTPNAGAEPIYWEMLDFYKHFSQPHTKYSSEIQSLSCHHHPITSFMQHLKIADWYCRLRR